MGGESPGGMGAGKIWIMGPLLREKRAGPFGVLCRVGGLWLGSNGANGKLKGFHSQRKRLLKFLERGGSAWVGEGEKDGKRGAAPEEKKSFINGNRNGEGGTKGRWESLKRVVAWSETYRRHKRTNQKKTLLIKTKKRTL